MKGLGGVEKFNKKMLAVLMILASVGIGGLFVGGAFLATPVLSWIPAIGHTIAGWALIVGTLGGVLLSWIK